MTLQRVLIVLAFAAILGVPFALRPAGERDPKTKDASVLVIITPHVPQIHHEFGLAFEKWYTAVYKEPIRLDWRYAGTSELLKQLEAQYGAALKSGKFDLSDPKNPKCAAGLIGYDLMFGGGTFDHGRLKTGVPFEIVDAKEGKKQIRVPMSAPAGFELQQLTQWFGEENNIGVQPLYDPEQFWIGTALSSFGIVYNRDVLARLGLKEPASFEDLTDARYSGWLALADPRQSGSIATSFDSILNNYGWEKGWRILREMCANTRYFTNSSPKIPIDVSAGEAAAGLAIDFYGRGQAQAVMKRGETVQNSRVGYSDPSGAVYIDADPISLLRGGPDPVRAKRFIEFCLTDEAQALWQFRASSDPGSAQNPEGDRGFKLGPQQYELRRLPVRRVMYTGKYFPAFIDQVDPYAIASTTAVKGWRSAIGLMMGAYAIDIADEQREAWVSLNAARSTPGFPPARLQEAEGMFYAWPRTRSKEGAMLEFTQQNFKAIRDIWRDSDALARCKIEYTQFFRENYRRVVELCRSGR